MVTSEDFKDFFDKHPISGMPKSIIIEYKDLEEWNPKLAEEILEYPDICLKEISQAASSSSVLIPVSIRNLPNKVMLRSLGSQHIGRLIELHGIVSRVVPIRPFLTIAIFVCKKCGEQNKVLQDESWMVVPFRCEHKQEKRRRKKTGEWEQYMGTCNGRRFRFVESESSFKDLQELTIQECPEDLLAGQLPRQVNLRIDREDLINGARAGDIVNVVGILRTRQKSPLSKERVFAIYFEVVYIDVLNKELSEIKILPEEEQEIYNLAMKPNIYELITQSIAPSIYGNFYIKEAIMYLLFGGVNKKKRDIKIRGEMNVLLVGDPATAKSQMLQVTTNISPRAIYTSGKGTTAAGLTAAVVKVEGEVYALEAGALVLADKGICCIDEIDKMDDNDRVAIHEAMEQHTVSINKAGINARLNARAAILAAANPDLGRYDKYKTVTENTKKLPVALLSRFDLIFIMRDKLAEEEDKALSAHILGMNKDIEELINESLLKKYIAYARNLNPKLSESAVKRLQEFYLEMRETGRNDEGGSSPVAITARQLESLIRISEAHAKIALKTEVDAEDAEAAIRIMRKSLEEVGINPENKQLDIDIIMGGVPKTDRDKTDLILNILAERGECSKDELVEEMAKRKVSSDDTSKLINMMMTIGKIFEPTLGRYKRT